MPRLCVIGHPIGHSLSPRIHNAALEEAGLAPEWTYEALDLTPERFEAGIAELPSQGFVGANVTIPHKEAALAAATDASDSAQAIGAANTLSFPEGGIRADNTDATGLLDALPSPPAGRHALVVGAGGAGRAAVWALRGAGAQVSLWNRTHERAQRVAEELGAEAISGEPSSEPWDIVVNATSVGMSDSPDASFKRFPLRADGFRDDQTFVDLVYRPGGTELTHAAEAAGAQVVDGLEVLVMQGAASFRIWTGLAPPIEVMRHAVSQTR